MAFRYTSSEAYVGEAIMKAPCDAKGRIKNRLQFEGQWTRGLGMLRNSESIQIKLLFKKERAISLTLDFNHLSLLRHFNDVIGDFWNNKIDTRYNRFTNDL